ncbi:MAG: hypothetical protein R2710_15230 [Acidimicrobiales bacterium]
MTDEDDGAGLPVGDAASSIAMATRSAAQLDDCTLRPMAANVTA